MQPEDISFRSSYLYVLTAWHHIFVDYWLSSLSRLGRNSRVKNQNQLVRVAPANWFSVWRRRKFWLTGWTSDRRQQINKRIRFVFWRLSSVMWSQLIIIITSDMYTREREITREEKKSQSSFIIEGEEKCA